MSFTVVRHCAKLIDSLLECCAYYGDDVSNLERLDGGGPDRLKSILKEEYKLADYSYRGGRHCSRSANTPGETAEDYGQP